MWIYIPMIPWTKKYQPEKISDVEDQDMSGLKSFVENYKKQKKKAAIIHGPSGNGKTSSVYALANELNLEVIEVNASDFRNQDKINASVGQAANQMSLFSKGKIILVDEIDGLSGTKDRGGVQAIIKIIARSAFPIILTSNNPYDQRFSSLRNKCELVQFKELPYTSVVKVLKKICAKENIKFDEIALKSLGRRCGGDLRSAITDLQTLCHFSKELTIDSLDDLGDREKTDTMFDALMKIFKTTDPSVAIRAFDHTNEDLDKAMLWLDENLPLEYKKPEDLARAYDHFSKADVFFGRIRRWQHWRYLTYVNALLTAGIATAKDEKYREFTKYKPTGRILKLWWAKQKNMKKKAICQKIADITHTSMKRAMQDTFPYLKHIIKKNKEQASVLAEQIDLSKEEINWLKK